MTEVPVLSILFLLPVAGAALIPFLRDAQTVRWFALEVLLADFLLALWVLLNFDAVPP